MADSFKPRVNFLISYEYWKDEIVDHLQGRSKDSYRLMIDSGAFTAWKQGKVIRLDDYARFLDGLSHLKPFQAIQLDVIGNEKQTRENFLELKRMGFDTLPVFTRGSSLKWLHECYEHTDYVLLGGVASGRGRFEYVDYFETINQGRKQHWLGVDKIELLKTHRPYSVDSSNFQLGAKVLGRLSLYSGAGNIKVYRKPDFIKAPPVGIAHHLRLIGLDEGIIALLKTKAGWTLSTSNFRGDTIEELLSSAHNCHIFISILSYYKRALDIEKKLGTIVYLSSVHTYDISTLFKCLDHLTKKNCL